MTSASPTSHYKSRLWMYIQGLIVHPGSDSTELATAVPIELGDILLLACCFFLSIMHTMCKFISKIISATTLKCDLKCD